MTDFPGICHISYPVKYIFVEHNVYSLSDYKIRNKSFHTVQTTFLQVKKTDEVRVDSKESKVKKTRPSSEILGENWSWKIELDWMVRTEDLTWKLENTELPISDSFTYSHCPWIWEQIWKGMTLLKFGNNWAPNNSVGTTYLMWIINLLDKTWVSLFT